MEIVMDETQFVLPCSLIPQKQKIQTQGRETKVGVRAMYKTVQKDGHFKGTCEPMEVTDSAWAIFGKRRSRMLV